MVARSVLYNTVYGVRGGRGIPAIPVHDHTHSHTYTYARTRSIRANFYGRLLSSIYRNVTPECEHARRACTRARAHGCRKRFLMRRIIPTWGRRRRTLPINEISSIRNAERNINCTFEPGSAECVVLRLRRDDAMSFVSLTSEYSRRTASDHDERVSRNGSK